MSNGENRRSAGIILVVIGLVLAVAAAATVDAWLPALIGR